MRKKGILNSVKTSPYMKRLVLMERAGIKLNDKQKKRLDESVSMVLPTKYHNRMGIQSSMMKQFKDLDDNDELDLSELDDDLDIYKLPDEDDDKLFDAILKEMGYYDEEEEDGDTIDMKDIPDVTDEELEDIIKQLEYATGERDCYD